MTDATAIPTGTNEIGTVSEACSRTAPDTITCSDGIFTNAPAAAQTAHHFDWSPFMPFVHVAEWIVGIIIAWSFFNLWFGPTYRVWTAHKLGEADLARAKNEQQIQIAHAQSRYEAAEANKKAAIVEAEAVSEQIRLIGQSAAEHKLYLTWQWIKMMEDRDGATVYVPTEANLPILEATRLPRT